MTLEEYRRSQNVGGLVGMSIQVDGKQVTITDYDFGRYFYTLDGLEHDFRDTEAGWLIADELARMVWPEL